MSTLTKRFDQFNDEYIKFDQIKNKLSNREDLHAFLLLDKLCPSNNDMIYAAEHDIFYLDIDTEAFEAVVTDEQINELVSCGVWYDENEENLCMYV